MHKIKPLKNKRRKNKAKVKIYHVTHKRELIDGKISIHRYYRVEYRHYHLAQYKNYYDAYKRSLEEKERLNL